MTFRETVMRLLSIRSGEEKALRLLVAFSFAMGVAVAVYYLVVTSLFLTAFSKEQFPIAYIAAGLIVITLGRFNNYSKKRVKFSTLSLWLIGLLALVIFVLFFTYKKMDEPVVVLFFMFVWIRVVYFVSGITFWIPASKLFNLQQAKRLFSLINSGDVIARILVFAGIPLLINHGYETEDFLYVAPFALLVALFLMYRLVKAFPDELAESPPPFNENTKLVSHDLTLSQIWKNKYFRYVFLLGMLPLIGLYFGEFLFSIEVKREFKDDNNQISSFMGIFLLVVSCIELAITTVFYRWMIEKFGLFAGVVALPLTLCVALIFAAGSYDKSDLGLFFFFILMSRFSLSTVRKSINDTSFQILYQPLPAGERLDLQYLIEGYAKSAGYIISGVILLLFVNINFSEPLQIVFIFLLVVVFWLFIVWWMHKEYRKKLDTIVEKNATAQKSKWLINFLREMLPKLKPQQVLPYLYVFKTLLPNLVYPEVKQLMPTASVPSQGALSKGLQIIHNQETKLLPDTISEPNNFDENFAQSKVLQLAFSSNSENRIQSAGLLGKSLRFDANKYLIKLLEDSHEEVKEAALIAAGNLGHPSLWSYLFNSLADDRLVAPASSAILAIGTSTIPALDSHFYKSNKAKNAQLRMIPLLGLLGGESAINALRKKLSFPDQHIKDQVIITLSNLNYKPTYLERDGLISEIDNKVETALWLLSLKVNLASAELSSYFHQAVNEAYDQQVEMIFHLLVILEGDKKIIGVAPELYSQSDDTQKGYATELLTMILPKEMKPKLVPLFENTSDDQKVRTLTSYYASDKFTVYDCLQGIVLRDFNTVGCWIKTLAIFELLRLFPQKSKPIFVAMAFVTTPLIAQAALYALRETDPERYELLQKELITTLPPEKAALLSLDNGKLIADQIKELHKSELFQQFRLQDLDSLGTNAVFKALKTGEEIPIENRKSGSKNYLLMVTHGEVNVYLEGGEEQLIQAINCGPSLFQQGSKNKITKVKATSAAEVYFLDRHAVYNLMSEHTKLIENILAYETKYNTEKTGQ
jgi:hypothetical protein